MSSNGKKEPTFLAYLETRRVKSYKNVQDWYLEFIPIFPGFRVSVLMTLCQTTITMSWGL